MAEWWVNNVGQNLLTGILDLAAGLDSRALPDEYILDFLTRIQEARASFLRLRGSLTANEQARLDPIYARAVQASATTDEKAFLDRVQTRWNRQGVRTAGPRGGTRAGGN